MIGVNRLAALVLSATLLQKAESGPPVVEPSMLTRDPNLIGREVVVDDRIRFFQAHRGSKGEVFDELYLKRTEVVFKLPPHLRPERPPRQPVARVRGVLQAEGKRITCDVSALELLPSDSERIDREVKKLTDADSAGRMNWAIWAERRAKDFKDVDLAEKGRALEVESILIDAERPKVDFLALSRRGRDRMLGEDLAAALAHRGLRERRKTAKTADDWAKLATDAASYLPRATEPHAGSGLEAWKARIETNPISVYRQAPLEIRAALDRDLYADVVRLGLERRVADRPGDALILAEEARTKLPDRPELTNRLRDQGLAASESNVAKMRLSEVDALAKTFRDDDDSERARKLYKTWLDDQRKRLNASDADGQILLAGQYERLLNDKIAASNLLRDALKADPQSKAAADAFRRMGYRKSPEGEWFDSSARRSSEETAVAETPVRTSSSGESLRGMTMTQVRAKLGGKPDRIVRSATQDATIEQWVYQGPRGTQVVNFRRARGRAEPEVVGSYAIAKPLP